MTNTDFAVSAAGVEKHYGGVAALKGVDIQIPKGSVYGLIGPNGAGKSTMFDVLCGIIKPTTGSVNVLGMDVTKLPAYAVAQNGVGRTFQRTAMFKESTVRENLLYASYGKMRHSVLHRILRLSSWRQDMAAFEEKVDEVLGVCGLSDLKDNEAASLAYGIQRRLAVAIMLMNDPKILFLDEPVAGMNEAETSDFIQLLRTVGRGRTIVIVEHDMAAIGALCDEVMVMVDGKAIVTDTPERALKHPDVIAAYLGADDEEP